MHCKNFSKPLAMAFLILTAANSVLAANKSPIPVEKTYLADQAISAYESGYDLYKRGHFNKAENKFIEALTHEPNLVKAHYWLGKLYRETGQLESAIFHWEEVERLNKLLKERRLALSIRNNEYPATTQMLRAVKLRAEAKVTFAKGLYLLDKGHWDGAEVELREAIRLYPANRLYLLTLARVLWDKEERKASIKFYRDLLALHDVTFDEFKEGVERMRQADMAYIAAPLVLEQKPRFSGIDGFAEICEKFIVKTSIQIPSAGKIVKRVNGQVIINIGLSDGISLTDEYSLSLRSFKPGNPIVDPDNGQILGRDPDQPSADLMITKAYKHSSWALIRKEFGSGVKAGDLIEIKKTIR